MPNQTDPRTGQPGPSILQGADGDLSWQPGQKLSRCTCAGEDHPGPRNPDGTFKGRASPELDMVEAYAYEKGATAYGSQSLQIAPYDDKRTVRLFSAFSLLLFQGASGRMCNLKNAEEFALMFNSGTSNLATHTKYTLSQDSELTLTLITEGIDSKLFLLWPLYQLQISS